MSDLSSFTSLDMLRRRWKVFRCSPLNGVQHNFTQKQARQIAKLIQQESKVANQIYHVSLDSCPELRRDQGPESLKIEVVADKLKLVYFGCFLNWSDHCEPKDNADLLPILLVDATQPNINVVHNVLRRIFDCVITPVEFNANQLLTLFAVMVTFSTQGDSRNAQLKYSIPGLPRMDAITANLRVSDISTVMEYMIRTATPAMIPTEFYRSLLEHLRNQYKLDLNYATLERVTLPVGMVDTCGQISMKNVGVVSPILQTLQEEISKSCVPSVTAPSIYSD